MSRYVSSCCPKVDGYHQDNMGHWHKTGRIGNQLVRSQRAAENMSMQRAVRTAVQNGDMARVLSLKYKV